MVSVVVLGGLTPQLKQQLDNQEYKDFEIIEATEPGIVNAMNIALSKAKGDILVRIDNDVELPTAWLKCLLEPFSDALVAGSTGPTYIPPHRWKNRDSINAVANANFFLKWLFDFEPFAVARIYKCGSVSYGSNFWSYYSDYPENPDHLEGTNWAMRTELIRQVGGFDPKFDGVCEWYDTDVEFKIKKLGYKLAYSYRAWLWHMVSKSATYGERFNGLGRIKNWLRFHFRHSKFHYKKIIWLLVMIYYFIKNGICRNTDNQEPQTITQAIA